MKKSLLALSIIATFALSACDDKALAEKLANAEHQIQQLTTDKATIQAELTKKEHELAELKQNQHQQKAHIPSLQVEIVEIFNKDHVIKHLKDPKDEFGSEETKINIFASIAKTGFDWIDQLLIKEIFENYPDNTKHSATSVEPTQQNLVNKFQQIYNEFIQEAKEVKPFALSVSSEAAYLGQRNNIISFVQGYYTFTGGAHGVGYSHYINIDANKKSVIRLNDLISPAQQAKLKELLWERYTEDRRDENGEISTFVEKKDFDIAADFYFTEYGISFVYPVYALGPYAEGEVTLELYFSQINELLNKDYQRTPKDGFGLNPIEL